MNNRLEAVQRLASRHYQIEPGITEIRPITLEKQNESVEPIMLLEVNENTVPSGIMPLQFDAVPASGIPFPSIIIEVTPEEFEKIQREELKLPDGWKLGPPLPRPGEGDPW